MIQFSFSFINTKQAFIVVDIGLGFLVKILPICGGVIREMIGVVEKTWFGCNRYVHLLLRVVQWLSLVSSQSSHVESVLLYNFIQLAHFRKYSVQEVL